jgi:hypothetical protein
MGKLGQEREEKDEERKGTGRNNREGKEVKGAEEEEGKGIKEANLQDSRRRKGEPWTL